MLILNKALSLAEELVTTTAEKKYWTQFSKIKILSKGTTLGCGVGCGCGTAQNDVLKHVFDQFW